MVGKCDPQTELPCSCLKRTPVDPPLKMPMAAWPAIERPWRSSSGTIIRQVLLLSPKLLAGWLIISLCDCIINLWFDGWDSCFNVVLFFQFRLLFVSINFVFWDGLLCVCPSVCLSVLRFQNSQRNLYTCESRTPTWFVVLDILFSLLGWI